MKNNKFISGKVLLLVLTSVLFAASFLLGKSISVVNATQNNSHNVTICHATGSNSNPFQEITVDDDAVNGNGASDHNKDNHQNGEDIIPPNYDNGSQGYWNSRNWDATGQGIWNNGCELPKEVKINHLTLTCGAGDRTISGTANFQGATMDHLVVKLDTIKKIDSHSEPTNWSFTVNLGVGSHTVEAWIYDQPNDNSEHGSYSGQDAHDVWEFTIEACAQIVDQCLNIDEVQSTVPGEMYQDENKSCHNKVRVCDNESYDNYGGADHEFDENREIGDSELCQNDSRETPSPESTPSPYDACFNLEGIQGGIPDGYHKDSEDGACNQYQLGGAPPPSDGGAVLGASTGKVLGASTMAGTGSFTENLYMAIMGLGAIITAFGAKKILHQA